MKVVENSLIPFPGFLGINLFGVLFVRKELWAKKSADRKTVTFNHEEIHTEQMKELGYIFFYLFYFIEWFLRLFINGSKAYDNISFEKEAYKNQENLEYIKTRKHFAQWRKKKTEA